MKRWTTLTEEKPTGTTMAELFGGLILGIIWGISLHKAWKDMNYEDK